MSGAGIHHGLLCEKIVILVFDPVRQDAHGTCLEVLIDRPASRIGVLLSEFHAGLPIPSAHVDEDCSVRGAIRDLPSTLGNLLYRRGISRTSRILNRM